MWHREIYRTTSIKRLIIKLLTPSKKTKENQVKHRKTDKREIYQDFSNSIRKSGWKPEPEPPKT